MDLKLDFKIALKYSLFVLLYCILEKLHLHFTLEKDYYPSSGTFYFLFILFPYFFAAIILLSFLEYIKYKKNYIDLIIISFTILFLFSVSNYIVNFSFYKLLYEDIPVPHEEGILGLMNRPSVLMKPQFNFLYTEFVFPFQYLKDAIISRDIFLMIGVMQSRIFIILILLYHFNLFFLFKKYEENKWYSLVPVLNKLILIRIAGKPVFWIVLVYVPFLSYFLMYSINKEIAEENGFDSKLALGMTILPSFFYGKISFNEEAIPVQL